MEGQGIAYMLNEMQKCKDLLTLRVDNSAALAMACQMKHSNKTRHIELRWNYVRDQIKKGLRMVRRFPESDNPADMFTEELPKTSIYRYRAIIGMQTSRRGVMTHTSEGACCNMLLM
ncbi:hypothetical protein KXD40_001647 [Peronospora effusa]|nr:hypothetical protein KXD40_001647 [Peronospora effusa]